MSDAARPTLKRQLGLWSAVTIVVGSTIGSGIFRSPAGVADKLPGPLPMLAVWVAGGLFAMCGALTLAELASARPNTGGIYVFLRDAWGRMYAFLFAWAQLVVIRAAALGAIAITFAEYAFRVAGVNPGAEENVFKVRLLASAALILTGTFNIIGVKWGALVSNVTTAAKYGGLLFIVTLALVIGLPSTGGHFTPVAPAGSFSVSMFGLALVSALWAFDGWADLSYAAGEVKDPQRNMPRALLIGTGAVLAIYLAANVGYLSVLSIDQIRTSPLVAADVAQVLIGAGGVAFVSTTVMISTFGTLNNSLFTAPRIIFAAADDELFPKWIARVHPRFSTPYVSIMLCITLGVVFCLAQTFEQLTDMFVIAFLPFYGLGVAAIFKLRGRADYQPAFRVPLYPIVPLIFLGSVTALLINQLMNPTARVWTMWMYAIILMGVPIYVARQRIRRSTP
ncbi:MAG TPA: amino acid permease [Gemmatimonadaceae bacterium]|nr:amino acid permease [Gemmatimonadaceae bacterium]